MTDSALAPWELELLNPGEYYECVGCGMIVLTSHQQYHMNTEHPKWPRVDQDVDYLAVSGDLEEIITEGRGWLWDCGINNTATLRVRAVLNYVQFRFEGGLDAFVLAVWPLVVPSRTHA